MSNLFHLGIDRVGNPAFGGREASVRVETEGDGEGRTRRGGDAEGNTCLNKTYSKPHMSKPYIFSTCLLNVYVKCYI